MALGSYFPEQKMLFSILLGLLLRNQLLFQEVTSTALNVYFRYTNVVRIGMW